MFKKAHRRGGANMQQDTLTLYKLIILFMLDKVDFPLTNAQISDFILEKGYTNYFNIQGAITALQENDFISTETIRNSSYFRIKQEGREVLGYCINDLSHRIQEEILEYLQENRYQLRDEVSVIADYYQESSNVFIAKCIAKDGNTNVIELNLKVASEEQASTICNKWNEKSQDIYAYLIQQLLAD